MDYVYVYVSTQHSQLERLFNLAMIIVLAEERSGPGVAFTNSHTSRHFIFQTESYMVITQTYLSN